MIYFYIHQFHLKSLICKWCIRSKTTQYLYTFLSVIIISFPFSNSSTQLNSAISLQKGKSTSARSSSPASKEQNTKRVTAPEWPRDPQKQRIRQQRLPLPEHKRKSKRVSAWNSIAAIRQQSSPISSNHADENFVNHCFFFFFETQSSL